MTSSPWVSLNARTLATTAAPTVEFERRAEDLLRLRVPLDALARRMTFPATGWSAWSFASCGVGGGVPTWAAIARYPDGELAGLLLLSVEATRKQMSITLSGSEQDTRGVLAVDSPETAEVMAQELAAYLRSQGVATELLLGPLDANDPSVHAFANALPGGRLVPDEPVPALEYSGNDLEEHLSHGMRRTIRKAQNRLVRDERRLAFHFTRDSHEILAMTPDMEQCHRERDHIHGRSSDLDDDRGRRIWRWRLREFAGLGHLELSTLHIDDQFAAYALGILDGDVYRVVEGRFVTNWARYAPGRLLEAAMLQRVLESPDLSRTDWLSSVAPETLIAANDEDPMVRIHWNCGGD
ncbi:MAG: GNAT family N-acetyltransferase [Actinomycetes bacterium]